MVRSLLVLSLVLCSDKRCLSVKIWVDVRCKAMLRSVTVRIFTMVIIVKCVSDQEKKLDRAVRKEEKSIFRPKWTIVDW